MIIKIFLWKQLEICQLETLPLTRKWLSTLSLNTPCYHMTLLIGQSVYFTERFLAYSMLLEGFSA